MSFYEIILIAISLAMDAFAVSLSVGTTGFINSPRPVFRIAFHFGFFQFLMPVLGWFIGYQIANQIAIIDHWIAFGLLSFVGFRMIRAGWSNHRGGYFCAPAVIGVETGIERNRDFRRAANPSEYRIQEMGGTGKGTR